jgi:uncharacterized protein (TIGR02217 family)
MAFEETRLNDRTSYGFVGGPSLKTRVKEYPNGAERRDRRWVEARWSYRAPYRRITPTMYHELKSAFLALGGMHTGCRFRDWGDYKAQMITGGALPVQGTGTGALQQVQLVKTYTFGSLSYTRNIYKPVTGTVQFYANGAPVASAPVGDKGIHSLTAPLGHELTADFEFDVPVRFDSDDMPWSYEAWQALTTDIALMELKGVNL